MRSGKVYFDGVYCGLVSEVDGIYTFTYDEAYLSREDARPVSLLMPLEKGRFESDALFPFFDGLLPEGEQLILAERLHGLAKDDRMGLLLKVCRDPIGAVTVEEVEDE